MDLCFCIVKLFIVQPSQAAVLYYHMQWTAEGCVFGAVSL